VGDTPGGMANNLNVVEGAGESDDDDLPPLSVGDAIWTDEQMYQPRVADVIRRLRAALLAEKAQTKRTDSSPGMLLLNCQIEAERGLDGRAPMWKDQTHG